MDSVREETLVRLRSEKPTVIGLGAIGSWVARWLQANGIPFVGFDDDIVALKNLASAAFAQSDMGSYKASAIGGDCLRSRWDSSHHTLEHSALVCADHGETRRAVAQKMYSLRRTFLCAKANGSLWQVWHVPAGSSPDDFCAFDMAAEADPVATPCGDSSVGRVASLGAAAEMLSTWSGLDITPREVEDSYGVKYDAALAHVAMQRWNDQRANAESMAAEEAATAFKNAIETARTRSDQESVRALEQLRAKRAGLRAYRRSTIHQRAIVALDNGENLKSAARQAVPTSRNLDALARAESRLQARNIERELSVPETITIEEAVAV